MTERLRQDHGSDPDGITSAVREAMESERRARETPEPSLGSRLGQIGVLGWLIVVPTLLGLTLGHWLDRRFHTGVFFAAPLLMVSAGIGLWCAWRWMHRQTLKDDGS
ncbi:ATP synthase gene 1 [Caballeronia sordidicola]|uniref:ATP synthase gene 1 n=1 Tax=Caballeronia sordidicola TaxID=196367 RepID=A0A158I6F1_CABSO|nr:AtpZ/AtpI family protein [Caballeronia sordidicola]SAL52182.1 ATP synthase gene 1 [Caballeronia sordidicola]